MYKRQVLGVFGMGEGLVGLACYLFAVFLLGVAALAMVNQEEAERPAPSRAECVQEGAA